MASQDPGERELDEGSCVVQSLSAADAYTDFPGDRHIRLLSLDSETGSEHEILRCSFIEQDIREVIPWAGYRALSYVWGASPERMPIICNGHELPITQNLHDALKQIWQITPKQLLWADTICINQKEDEEIALQVGMMGEIYKAATIVLVWLGTAKQTIAGS